MIFAPYESVHFVGVQLARKIGHTCRQDNNRLVTNCLDSLLSLRQNGRPTKRSENVLFLEAKTTIRENLTTMPDTTKSQPLVILRLGNETTKSGAWSYQKLI
jgi:hypothetical protein